MMRISKIKYLGKTYYPSPCLALVDYVYYNSGPVLGITGLALVPYVYYAGTTNA
jgi:hypothetical protein